MADDLFVGGSFKGDLKLSDLVKAIDPSITPFSFDVDVHQIGASIQKNDTVGTYSLYVDASLDLFLAGQKIEATIIVDVNYEAEGDITFKFSGSVIIADKAFTIEFDDEEKSEKITVKWETSGDDYLEIQDLISALNLYLPDIPPEIDLGLKSVSFSYELNNEESKSLLLEADSVNYGKSILVAFADKTDKSSETDKYQYFFGVTLTDIDLSGLPLVGPDLAKVLKVDKLQIAIASQNIDKDTASKINSIIQDESYPNVPKDGIATGVDISSVLVFLDKDVPLHLAIGSKSPAPEPEPEPEPKKEIAQTSITGASDSVVVTDDSPEPSSSISTAVWYKVQKTVGPIVLDRVGFGYDSGDLWLLFDSGLDTKALSIDLTSFGLGVPVSKPKPVPDFMLDGLGVRLDVDPVALSGTLLTASSDSLSEDVKFQYDGELGVKVMSFNVSVYGSYAQLKTGSSSLFSFAVIDYPLGGIPAFFITGGSAGFGYNRQLLLPSIDDISDYPLVVAANNPEKYKEKSLSEVLKEMEPVIPNKENEYWLSAGINFVSYEVVKSYALTAVNFGLKLEIVLIGLSDLSMPKNVSKPIAQAQLALEARILPDEGFFGIDAKLTPDSYILDKKCVLTGGFAFYIWFGSNLHSGDFVLTLGGYHSRFNKPDYYPVVPRLGFNWNVEKGVVLKGGIYFALTPVCVMAGGDFSATWDELGIKAWFDLNADLLIFWKPYSYDINVGTDVGVSACIVPGVTSTRVTMHVDADLHVWGPDFNVNAHIHLYFISFTITIGSGTATKNIEPIGWDEFKGSFLCADDNSDKICSISVISGLRKTSSGVSSGTNDEEDHFIVDSEHFCLVTNSLIPSKETVLPSQVKTTLENDVEKYNTDFGVGLVQVENDDLGTKHQISFTRDGKEYSGDMLEFEPILQSVSQAMWQNIETLSDLEKQGVASGSGTIDNVLVGYNIYPKIQSPDKTLPVSLKNLLYGDNDDEKVIDYLKPETIPTQDSFDQSQVLDKIKSTVATNSKREQALNILSNSDDFSINEDISVDSLEENIGNYFMASPILSYLGEEKPYR